MKSKTPKNKWWIIAMDNDSYNFAPSLESIAKCKKHGIKVGYRKMETAQKKCDKLNSL